MVTTGTQRVRIQRGKCFAVVTGDVVRSSRLPRAMRAALPKLLMSASNTLQRYFPSIILSGNEVFRGDSWQFVVSQPSRSLRTALFFRAYLKSELGGKDADARIAIGLGTVEFVPKGRPSMGDGEAFHLSGAALDRMPRSRRMSLAMADEMEGLPPDVADVLVELIDVLARGWTDRQASAVCGKLLGWNQSKVAKSWFGGKVSQQAIGQHLDRAGWNAIEAALNLFERKVEALD